MNEEEIQLHSSEMSEVMVPEEEKESEKKRNPRVLRKMRNKLVLIKIQRQRDPKIFARLYYDEHVEKIYRYVFLKVNLKELAEDITGETFLKAWHHLQEANDVIHDPQAFLYRIARNLVFDYYRKKVRADVTLGDEILKTFTQEDHEIKKVEERSEFEYIKSYLKSLKEEYQEVLLLRYVEGLGIAEIASVLGKKKGATRVLIHRALNTLKKMIEEEEISQKS